MKIHNPIDTDSMEAHWADINKERHRERGFFKRTSAADAIFQQICDQFFLGTPKRRVFEIGCAPGRKLARFAERYSAIPYGVEYTQQGVATAQKIIRALGFSEDHIFFSDVFDKGFQARLSNTFDVVMSFGFIEHFNDLEPVIDAHVAFLKKDGFLLVMIPNLRGIYTPLLKFFAPRLLDIHNLSIMSLPHFSRLFVRPDIEPVFCGYYGVFNLGMLQADGRWKRIFLTILQACQSLGNFFLVRCHRWENKYTSP